MSVEGHGTCLGPEVCAERSLGAASLSGQGSVPQADGRGRGELLEARAPRFLRRAQAPRPHTPEMPQKPQHSTVQTAHFRRTARAANAGTGNGAPARPRASRVPGRVRQQPPRSHLSPA